MAELKCKASLVINTTSTEIENFIKEVTGHTYDFHINNPESYPNTKLTCHVNGSTYLATQYQWFKDTGEVGSHLHLENILNGLAIDGMLSVGTYIIQIESAKTNIDLLSSDAKGMLHDACVNLCNDIKHSKYSDLHQNMVDAVWEAANKVLRTHSKNNS